jgi:hypothetical protein
MANTTTATCLPLFPSLEMAWRDVDSSFERFCLTAGIGAVEQMLRQDAQQLTGAPHSRGGGRAPATAGVRRRARSAMVSKKFYDVLKGLVGQHHCGKPVSFSSLARE